MQYLQAIDASEMLRSANTSIIWKFLKTLSNDHGLNSSNDICITIGKNLKILLKELSKQML